MVVTHKAVHYTCRIVPSSKCTNGINLDNLLAVAEQFTAKGKVLDIREYGSGNVNNTFLAQTDSEEDQQIILQRINTNVFARPERIMHNLRTLIDHVDKRMQSEQSRSDRRWVVPHIIATKDGSDYFIDHDGSFWRAISFITGAQAYETIKNRHHAEEAGYGLGRFHCLVNDLNPQALHDTLKGFHITPLYLKQYDEFITQNPSPDKSADTHYCHTFIRERREWAPVLEKAKQKNELQLRPIHGDPKISNFMIDDLTGQAVSLIDLDTVKPGLIHYDLGDCLRSCCNPSGEEATNLEDVFFDTELCKAILRGYQSQARDFLTEQDYLYLYDAIRLLAFELGVRFFCDFLAGNVYFKVRHQKHNLRRALVQFRLTESIEAQENAIRNIIKDLK